MKKLNPSSVALPFAHSGLTGSPLQSLRVFFMEEIWKNVIGFNGIYQVSTFGRVKSISRKVCAGRNGGVKIRKEIIKKSTINKLRFGYVYIGLLNKTKSLHRLVWETFNGKIPIELEINHIDGNKLNNNLSNLELVTSSENKLHAFNTGLKFAKKGGSSLLSKKIIGINELGDLKRYNAISDVSLDGFNKCNIILCLKGINKTHRGYKWYYETR